MGVMLSSVLWGHAVTHEKVQYAATLPGTKGTERRISRRAGHLVPDDDSCAKRLEHSQDCALYRSHRRRVGRNLHHARIPVVGYEHEPGAQLCVRIAGTVSGKRLWVYFTAPPLGMLLAAEVYSRLRGKERSLLRQAASPQR